jgi:DNA repair ATPase RecN
MSEDSRNKRERLKKKYKAHYRKMRQDKERLSRAKKTHNISKALKEMDKTQMLESVDNFLHTMKHKLASVEARLDVAMDDLSGEGASPDINEQELDEQMNRTKAKETLKQLKIEMGLLYEEIEQQADTIQVEKTIGSGKPTDEGKSDPDPDYGNKSTNNQP